MISPAISQSLLLALPMEGEESEPWWILAAPLVLAGLILTALLIKKVRERKK